MAAISTTGTLTAGNSRTFALAPGSALTLTLLPNARVTVTESPETVSASDAGGNSPRPHFLEYAGVFTYGPYAMGGTVVVANASNSGSTVTWGRKDTTVTTNSTGTSLVSGDGTLYLQSRRRSEALVRFQGICKASSPFNISASTVNQTYTVKLEVEAPFSGVRILSDNGAPNAQTGNKMAIGVTETNAVTATALTASQNMSVPVIGGVAYDSALVTSGNLGYKQVTWATAATWDMLAGNAARQYKLSDWMSLQSVARADGGTRPLFLMRQKPDPTGYNFLVSSALMRSATTANRGRTVITSTYFGDGLTTPNGVHALGTTYTDTYPIFRFNVPVLSVWGVGDSIQQGNSTLIIADGYSNFVARACADASTTTKPVVYANLGCNGQTADYYWTNAKALLAAGVPPPSVLVTAPASVNDGGSTPTVATIDAQRDRGYDMIATCKLYGIPAIIWLPWLVNENLTDISTTFYDSKRKQINAELKAIAEAAGIAWITLSGLGDGATPEKWVTAYEYDAFHPNELAHESVMAPALAAVLTTLNN